MPDKNELFKEWIKFKKAEDKAKENRNKVEVELVDLYGTAFKGNSKTFKEEDLGFNINLKKNIKYNLDENEYKSIRSSIPTNLRPEKIKYSLDVKGFEYLKNSENETEKKIYKKVSNCVEIKPNKPTIKVEKI